MARSLLPCVISSAGLGELVDSRLYHDLLFSGSLLSLMPGVKLQSEVEFVLIRLSGTSRSRGH